MYFKTCVPLIKVKLEIQKNCKTKRGLFEVYITFKVDRMQ